MTRGSILGMVGALLLGVWLGWHAPGLSPAEAPRATSEIPTKVVRPPAGHITTSSSREMRTEVDRVLAMTSPAERLRAVVDLANRTPASTLPRWADRGYLGSGDRIQDELFKHIVLGRLLQSDPESAMRLAMHEHTKIRDAQFTTWMMTEPNAAQRFLLGPMNPEHRRPLAVLAMAEWVQSDPDRALDVLDGLSRHANRSLAWDLRKQLPPLARSHRDEIIELSRQWPATWRYPIQVAVASATWQGQFRETLEWMVKEDVGGAVFAGFLQDGRTGWNESNGQPFLHDHKVMQEWGLLDHLDLVPEPWIDTALRQNGFVMGSDALGWLNAEAGDLGIAPELLERIQCRAAYGFRDVRFGTADEAVRLMDGAPPKVQAALAKAVIRQIFYRNREEAKQWAESLDHPAARAAAQRRFVELNEPDKAFPWLE